MKHNDLQSMLADLYGNTDNSSQRPHLMAVGWAQDNPLVVQLAAIDFDLHYAKTVSDALQHLRNHRKIDVVVINSAVVLDAYVVTAALRLYTQSPIVLLFGEQNPVNPMHAVDAGADDWLPTSVHPREFTARIYARIRRHRFTQRRLGLFRHPSQALSSMSSKQVRSLS